MPCIIRHPTKLLYAVKIIANNSYFGHFFLEASRQQARQATQRREQKKKRARNPTNQDIETTSHGN